MVPEKSTGTGTGKIWSREKVPVPVPEKILGTVTLWFIQLGKLLIEFRLTQKCNLVMLMLENEMKCEHRDLARVK